jgi:hypothetical protein
MPVFGDLGTMPLTDVLQWIAEAGKTGILEIERGQEQRRIEFCKGFVSACASDAAEGRFGQFLVARGRLTPEQLEEALALGRKDGARLGYIAVERGWMARSEVSRLLASYIEERLQALFAWESAIFRFYAGASFGTDQVEVLLPVRDVLLRGVTFQDELRRLREAFGSSGAVLRATDQPAPDEVLRRGVSRSIYQAIDGKRSLGEILRTAPSAERLVLRLLFRLLQMGLVEVVESREPLPGSSSLLDPDPAVRELDPARAFESDGDGLEPASSGTQISDIQIEMGAGRRLMGRGEWLAAVELLEASQRAHPHSDELDRLLQQAERGYLSAAAARRITPSSRLERRALEGEDAEQALAAEESYLIRLIDEGSREVNAILARATLREAEVVEALERMVDRGLIRIGEADPSPAIAAE